MKATVSDLKVQEYHDETEAGHNSNGHSDKTGDAHAVEGAETQVDVATIFKNVTRYTTPEERAKVERIDLDPADLDKFMELLQKGLLQAAAVHDTCVQRNFALSAETTIRLSRPVYNAETDSVEQHEGKIEVKGKIKARKIYKQSDTK